LCRSGGCSRALRVLDDAPNQREGAPRAWIRFDEQVAEGAKDLRPGDEIVVLTWLHLSPRDELSTHPEDDMSQPLTGVFSTCSPNRPNPIGLHRARIVARDGFGLKLTLWRQSTGRRWWTSSRPSTRPHDALHAAHLALGRATRLRPGPPPIAERGRRSGGSRAKSRR
jgi:hypothetical protein